MNKRQIVWHYDVHREHAEEDLRFYLLKFAPSYDREIIFQSFQTFCEEHKIYSFGLYEVFGPVDLIFRCWLPHDNWVAILNDFEKWKGTMSAVCHVEETEQFDVLSCKHHYLWHDAKQNLTILPDIAKIPLLLQP